MTIFESDDVDKKESFFIDERLNPSDLVFVVYLLADKLTKITLTEILPSVNFLGYPFGIINNKLHIDGWSTEIGFQEIKGMNFLILSRDNAKTYFFIFNRK